jgi:DNA-directed RNA polymerase subunit RPC12/RpoP
MIDLGSIAGLRDHDHELHGYCARCERWNRINLDWLVQIGQGEQRLPIRVRCRMCGERGMVQVRSPMPVWGNQNGWIMPRQHSGH